MSISTCVLGNDSMISRQASTPSLPGIITSITTTSGSTRCAVLTASSPSEACPTTSKSSSASRASRSPFLMMGWSSATITLIRTLDVICITSGKI